jgi:hypothetical protein
MAKKKKVKIKKRKISDLEKYALQQCEKYVRIQRDNEKDLKYIG